MAAGRRAVGGFRVRAMSQAHATGCLLGAARGSDVVDASVVALAASWRASIVTGDPDDIERLVAACGIRLTVLAI